MDKKKILLLGASITQGKISSSYEKLLKKRYPGRFEFVNHGVAGYESYNVLSRLDRSIASKPDIVLMLLGTNDVMSSLDPKLAKLTRKLKKIPYEPELVRYSRNITDILYRFREKTQAKIALLSLPVLGENLTSRENERIDEYNAELRRIAVRENAAYLPVNEKMKEFLKLTGGGSGLGCDNATRKAFASLLMHYLLFRSFDSISEKNGFRLLTDGIHLNGSGAAIVAEEAARFIDNKQVADYS